MNRVRTVGGVRRGFAALLAVMALAAPAHAALLEPPRFDVPPQVLLVVDDTKSEARSKVAEAERLLDTAEGQERAIALLREAVSLEPGEPGHGLALGSALNKLHRPAEAIEALQAAIAQAPRFGAAYLEWGKALMTLGQFDEAVTRFEAAAPVMGDDVELYTPWCSALETLGRDAEAEPICARAAE